MPQRIPNRRLVEVLRDSVASAGDELDRVRIELEKILEGDGDEENPLDLNQIVALGLLGMMKAQRESGLLVEIAIREEMVEFTSLADNLASVLGELKASPEREQGSRELHAVPEPSDEGGKD